MDTDSEDDYDDVLPLDGGRFNEGMDKNLIKKVIVIIGVVLLIRWYDVCVKKELL